MTLPIQTRFINTIEQHGLLPGDASVVVGVSGGADSICLLHLLASHYSDLTVGCVYIDHRLRPDETEAEKQLVQALCKKLGLEFTCLEIDVPTEVSKSGESVEACARTLRYDAFDKCAEDAGAKFIAVGHTRDDQVEEVLLRLIRGSGLKGLSGMDYRSGRVIRPLLDATKAEVLEYLEHHHLSYCEDSSNRSRRFLRNRVRLDLLPLLEHEFNPAIRDSLTRMAGVFKAEDAYLQDHMSRAYSRVVVGSKGGAKPGDSPAQHRLQIASFFALHLALQRRVLEELCWKMTCRPNAMMIDNIIEFAGRATNGSEMHLPGRLRLIKEPDALLFSRLDAGQSNRQKLAAQVSLHAEITGSGTYRIEELQMSLQIFISAEPLDPTEAEKKTMILDADRVAFPLVLRTPKPGERFRPLNGPGSKKISRYLSDKKIPAHLRSRYPILSHQGQPDILCIVGLAIAEDFKITPDTKRFLVVRWLNEEVD